MSTSEEILEKNLGLGSSTLKCLPAIADPKGKETGTEPRETGETGPDGKEPRGT